MSNRDDQTLKLSRTSGPEGRAETLPSGAEGPDAETVSPDAGLAVQG